VNTRLTQQTVPRPGGSDKKRCDNDADGDDDDVGGDGSDWHLPVTWCDLS